MGPFEPIVVYLAAVDDTDMRLPFIMLYREVVEHVSLKFVDLILGTVLIDDLPFVGGNGLLKIADALDDRALRLQLEGVLLVFVRLHQRLPSGADSDTG